MRRLFVIPVNECAFQATRSEEHQTTRLTLLQLALAAIHARTPPEGRHIFIVASQVCAETAGYLGRSRETGYIQDLVLSSANIEHGVAMDIATHHGVSRWHDRFYCQDMDVEILSDEYARGVDELLTAGSAHFVYDSLTPVTHYGNQVVPRRPLCCVLAGLCEERVRFPVTLEHMQGEIPGRDPSPLRLDRVWAECARELERGRRAWPEDRVRREFHTDTGYAFIRLAPLWGLRTMPMPESLRAHYVHRAHLSPRFGLSHVTDDGRTVRDHLDEARTRLRELYGVEPA
jgi:hypothetical protein